jgi:hypothetical protein
MSSAWDRATVAKKDAEFNLDLLQNALAAQGAEFNLPKDKGVTQELMKTISSSMANACKPAKGGHPTLPSLQGVLIRGGREVNPADESQPFAPTASVAVRRRALTQVGKTVIHTRDHQKGGMHRVCLQCPANVKVLLSLFEGLSLDQIKEGFRDESLKLSKDQFEALTPAPLGRWFCNCAPGPLTGGSVLLLPMPGTVFRCPGKGCGVFQAVPSEGFIFSCGYCPIMFGFGTVKQNELESTQSDSLQKTQQNVDRHCYEYLVLHGGTPKLAAPQGFVGSQLLLAKYICDPPACPTSVQCQTNARFLAFTLGFRCTMNGLNGFGLSDFQRVDKIEPTALPLHDLAGAIKKAESSQPPPWQFKATDSVAMQTMVIEAAAENALYYFTQWHGEAFCQDPKAFMEAYRAETYDMTNSEEWTPYRRWMMLWACIVDFSKRLQSQMMDETSDQRYFFEMGGPIRIIFYYNSDTVLRHVEEPLEKAVRKAAVADSFAMPASSCAGGPKPKQTPTSCGISTNDLKELERMTKMLNVQLDLSGDNTPGTPWDQMTPEQKAEKKSKDAAAKKVKTAERKALKKAASAKDLPSDASAGLREGEAQTRAEAPEAHPDQNNNSQPGENPTRGSSEAGPPPPVRGSHYTFTGQADSEEQADHFRQVLFETMLSTLSNGGRRETNAKLPTAEEELNHRPCVYCSLITGNWCDGCEDSYVCPQTGLFGRALCTECEEKHEECAACQGGSTGPRPEPRPAGPRPEPCPESAEAALHIRAIEGARTMLYQFFGACSPRTAVSPKVLYAALFERPVFQDFQIPYQAFVTALQRVEYLCWTPAPHVVVYTDLVGNPQEGCRLSAVREAHGEEGYRQKTAQVEQNMLDRLGDYEAQFVERFGSKPPSFPYHHRLSHLLGYGPLGEQPRQQPSAPPFLSRPAPCLLADPTSSGVRDSPLRTPTKAQLGYSYTTGTYLSSSRLSEVVAEVTSNSKGYTDLWDQLPGHEKLQHCRWVTEKEAAEMDTRVQRERQQKMDSNMNQLERIRRSIIVTCGSADNLGALILTYYDPLLFPGEPQDFHGLAKTLEIPTATADSLFDLLRFRTHGTPLALEEAVQSCSWAEELEECLSEAKEVLQPQRPPTPPVAPEAPSLEQVTTSHPDRRPSEVEEPEASVKNGKLALKPGDFKSDALIKPMEKILHSCPCTKSGKHYCPLFQTALGCDRDVRTNPDAPCQFAHEVLPVRHWSAEWQEFFLAVGGHKDLGGEVAASLIQGMMDSSQAAAISALTNPVVRAEALLHFLHTRVSNLVRPNGEHLNSTRVQTGAGMHGFNMWDAEAPYQIAAPSGLEAKQWFRAAVGPADAFVSGLLIDLGDQVKFPDGTTQRNMCGILAVAALARSAKPRSHRPECDPGFVLLMQCLQCALEIPESLLLDNLNSRLTEVHNSIASLEGLPDSWPSILAPQMLKGYHLLHICQDVGDLESFTYRFNVVHSALEGCVFITARTAKSLLQPWTFDHEGSFIFSLPVLVIAPLIFKEGRHSFALKTGMHTMREVVEFLAQIATQHKGQVILQKRGGFTHAARTSVAGGATKEQVDSSRIQIQQLYDRGRKALMSVPDPWPTPLLVETEPAEGEECPKPWELLSTISPSPASGASQTPPQTPEADRATLWETLRPHAELCTTSQDRFKLYARYIEPLLKAVEEKNTVELRGALSLAGRFNNHWLEKLIEQENNTPKEALQAIVQGYRDGFFGSANVTHGPHPDSVEDQLLGKIPKEHLDLFSEMIRRGADPVYLGPRVGYKARPYPSTEAIDNQALWDGLALDCAQRALNFDLSEDPKIGDYLIQAGVHLGPIIAAPKRSAHGQDLVDEWGDLILRLCNDSTNGNHPLAANTGLRAWQHSFQKTTSPSQIAHNQIKEENKHPNCEPRAVRDDVAKAFNLIAVLLRRVGLFASLIANFAFVNLNLPFGPVSSPGIFDVLGDVFVKGIQFMDRPLQTEPHGDQESEDWDNPIGDTHPEVARFVDDLFSVVAMYGNRMEDHLLRLRGMLTSCLGDHALNLTKQGVEGTPEPYKHAFGSVLDCCGRTLKASWSKLIKAADLLLPYVNRAEAELKLTILEKVRGVVGHATVHAPGVARMLLPRFDAYLSSVALKHPGKNPPKDAVGSFFLSGDPSEEYANERTRTLCNIFIRLALIEEGELFQLPLEATLPRAIRVTFPGKERPENRVRFVMDASGTGYFIIDISTGRYLWEKFTAEENHWFNRFEAGEHATTINHREYLTQLRGAVALGIYHPGKLVDFINDNQCAVADTQKPQCSTAKGDLVSCGMGLIQLMLQQTYHGEYIETTENPADYPTRDASHAKAHEWLAQFKARTGLTPEKVELTGDLAWLKSVGWEDPVGVREQSSFLCFGRQYLNWLATVHPEVVHEACPVPLTEVQNAFEAGIRGDQIEPLPEFIENFPEVSGPSPQRKSLTDPKRQTHTRMSLTRQLVFAAEEKRSRNTKLLQSQAQPQHQTESDPQVLINSILQRQFEQSYSELEVKNQEFNPHLKPRPMAVPQVVDLQRLVKDRMGSKHAPELRTHENMPFASGYTGQNGAGKAARYCHYQDLRAAESNPLLREHIKRDSPQTEVDSDVSVFLSEGEAKIQYATMYMSPHCTSYSAANNAARHTEDKDLGKTFEDTAAIYEAQQISCGITECVKGVLERIRGKPSALDGFKKKAPNFHVVVAEVNAAEIISPITDEQAAMSHERVVVFVFHKSDYPKCPKLDLLKLKSTPLQSFSHLLDHPEEGASYQVMPIDDRRDLDYQWKRSQTGIAYVAKIRDPGPGRGHPNFVNDVISPELGRASTSTAAGGTTWLQASLNGVATVRRGSNRESGRLHLVRGFEESSDNEMLDDTSEIGQSLLGNMLPQNTNDMVMAQAAVCMSTVQPDGLTGYEKWLLRRAKATPPSLQELEAAVRTPIGVTPTGKAKEQALSKPPRTTRAELPKLQPTNNPCDTPCACPILCSPKWSDTCHGSHGFECEAAYRKAFPWKFSGDPPSIGPSNYLIMGTSEARKSGQAQREKDLREWRKQEPVPKSAGPVAATPPSRLKNSRLKPQLTPVHKQKYLDFSREVRYHGKKQKTKLQYTRAMRHWIDFCQALQLPEYIDDLSYAQRSEQAEMYASYEILEFGNKVSTIRGKLSAIRWMHVRERRKDPFKSLDTLTDWLTELEKTQSPKDPSTAVPSKLLELIILSLNTDTVVGAIIASACTLGFWFLLRSIEYLADDCGVFDPDRSLTWGDVTVRKEGAVLSTHQMSEADEITITIFSGKGSLHTCTRSLKQNEDSPSCAVKWMKNLYATLLAHSTVPQPGDSLFKKPDGSVLSRKGISSVLKAAAVACGVISSKVASHSLRRGGASAYAAAGVPHCDIQKFGRWTSDGYKVYITIHADVMTQGKVNPALVVPRFERN